MSRHVGTSGSVRSDQRGPERYSAEADGAAPARANSGHPRQRDPVKERDTGSRPQRKEAGTLEKEAEGRSKETCGPLQRQWKPTVFCGFQLCIQQAFSELSPASCRRITAKVALAARYSFIFALFIDHLLILCLTLLDPGEAALPVFELTFYWELIINHVNEYSI